MDKLFNILRLNKMVTRPEYYSGRGATMGDLNGKMLEGIYQGIKKDFSTDAAKNFVKMVEDIKVLSATTFLEELYMLYNNNWKYENKTQHASGVTVPKDENGEYDMLGGMFGMMEAMMSSGRDDTQMIKNGFLIKRGVKPLKSISADGYETMYYFD